MPCDVELYQHFALRHGQGSHEPPACLWVPFNLLPLLVAGLSLLVEGRCVYWPFYSVALPWWGPYNSKEKSSNIGQAHDGHGVGAGRAVCVTTSNGPLAHKRLFTL